MSEVKKATESKTDKKTTIFDLHFSNVSKQNIWNRHEYAGFYTVPRTMPLVHEIMDLLSKGKPLSKHNTALWARTEAPTAARGLEDRMIVPCLDEKILAIESGFFNQRGVGMWKSRLMILEELGFIQSATENKKAFGQYQYILIRHPIVVVHKLAEIRREFKENSDLATLYSLLNAKLSISGGQNKRVPKKQKKQAVNNG